MNLFFFCSSSGIISFRIFSPWPNPILIRCPSCVSCTLYLPIVPHLPHRATLPCLFLTPAVEAVICSPNCSLLVCVLSYISQPPLQLGVTLWLSLVNAMWVKWCLLSSSPRNLLAFSLGNSHVLLGRKNLSPRSLSLTPHCPELGDRPYSVPRMDSTWNRLTHSRSSLNICWMKKRWIGLLWLP